MTAWVEGSRRLPAVILLLPLLLLAAYALPSCSLGKDCQGWILALTPVGKFGLSGAPSPATSPTVEGLPGSPLPSGRGKRQEVRQRLGTQLQQPRAPFPPPALGLWGRGSPGRKARAATSQRGPRSAPLIPPRVILPSEPQHRGSSFGTVLRLGAFCSLCGHVPSPTSLTMSCQKTLPLPRGSCPYLGIQSPGTHLHTLHHSESPSCCLTSVLLAAASALIFSF